MAYLSLTPLTPLTPSQYLKVRTKYHREITNYFTNRAKIEARHLQQMTKLAKHTLDSVKDLAQDENLPLVDLLRSSVEQVRPAFENPSNWVF